LRTHQILNKAAERQELMSVETVQLFTSDNVKSVLLSRGYIYAIDHATDSLLCR